MRNKIYVIVAFLVIASITAILVIYLTSRDEIPPDGTTANVAMLEAIGIPNIVRDDEGLGESGGVGDLEESQAIHILPTALGEMTITALNDTPLGIAPDTAFLITPLELGRNLTETDLHSYLTVAGGKSFILEPQPENSFILHLNEELTHNQIYNIVYNPPDRQALSFAFQTTDIFRITETSPRHNAHNVPSYAAIEIVFSQQLRSLSDFENAFSIYPPVTGSFLNFDNSYIFSPNALAFNTTYTVTIVSGLVCISGKVIEDDFSFSFTTRWGDVSTRPAFSVASPTHETFLPWDEVFVALNINRNDDRVFDEFRVEIFDLETPQNFITFIPHADTATNLVETMDVELVTIEIDQWTRFDYLFLDKTLPEGYYVLRITPLQHNTEYVVYKFIQVNAISVYSMSLLETIVFWIHDAYTGLPASGAIIDVGGRVVTTDSDGVAIVEVPPDSRVTITIEYDNYMPFVYTQPTFASRRLLANNRFLSYMYTDRPNYRTSDTINVYGVIRPRYGHSFLPDDVIILHIDNLIEIPITLDSFDSFAVTVPITNMRSNNGDIRVTVNGEHLMSTWVRIFDYTNLGYVLEASINRLAYLAGDMAEVEITVSTYTGFPVEGLTLTHGHGDNMISIVTDEYGIAMGYIPVSLGWTTGWLPMWNSFGFSTASDNQSAQWIAMPYILVPSDIMLEHEFISDSSMRITTNQILIEQINNANIDDLIPPHDNWGDWWGWSIPSTDSFRGAPVDVDFTIEITRHVTTRTIRSQHYDRINRRMVTLYNHTHSNELYRTIEGRTTNGVAQIHNIPVSSDPLIRYSIEISYYDTRGRRTVVSANFVDPWWNPTVRDQSTMRFFSLNLESNSGTNRLNVGETALVSVLEQDFDTWENMWMWDSSFNANRPLTEGRMIAILARDTIVSVVTGSPQGVPITFTEACISEAQIFGAYFDGQYIFPVNHPITVRFDYTHRELSINLDFDQSNYRPGDEVTITLQTLNTANSPVPAQVQISVVDETSILRPHTPDFLRRFYQSAWLGWVPRSVFASHTQHNFGASGSGAEGGGGGDGGMEGRFRQVFVDNPVFETVQTDENGMATLTFTLPDQTTSWRVTALGITQDGYVGDSRENIISTLPFYIDLMLTNEYIVGDDIAAAVRTFSADGQHRMNTVFTFEILQNGTVIYSDTQTAIGNTTFNAGKLGIGSYTMRVTATAGDYRDAVEKPFTVTETGMIFPVRTMQQISPGDYAIQEFNMFPFPPVEETLISGYDYVIYIREFNMLSFPVEVTLTNANIHPLMNILNTARNRASHRTDYMAAEAFARHFFSPDDCDFAADVRSRVHMPGGGIPQLTYSSVDFFYTARFAASLPEFVEPSQIVRYVNNQMTRNDVTQTQYYAGLLALAAVGEPVLLRIQREIDINYSYQDIYIFGGFDGKMSKLYLVAALIAAGDYTGAYNLMTNSRITRMYSLTPSQTETIDALLLFINTTLNPQAAWDFLYNREPNSYVSDVPERINFVRSMIGSGGVLGGTVSEVEYFRFGTTHTVRLGNFDRVIMRMTAEEYEMLNLRPLSGVTDVAINFYAYDTSNWDSSGNIINITKSITRVDHLYRIEFDIILPSNPIGSTFTIHDRLPSNKRFVPVQLPHRAEWQSVQNIERQHMEIHFHMPAGQTHRTISYYAMMLFEANMEVGTAFITNRRLGDNLIWGTTQ